MHLCSLPKSVSLLVSLQVSLEQEEKEDLKGIVQAHTCVHVHTYMYTNVVIAAQCTVTMVPHTCRANRTAGECSCDGEQCSCTGDGC